MLADGVALEASSALRVVGDEGPSTHFAVSNEVVLRGNGQLRGQVKGTSSLAVERFFTMRHPPG